MSGSTLNIVTAVLALISAGLFGWAWSSYQRGQKSLAWPSVSGVIKASGVRASTSEDSSGTPSTSYFPEVEYDYEVGYQGLSGFRIGVGNTSAPSQSAATAIAGRYAVGSKVEVFYDPADPAYAVLVRGTNLTLVLCLAGSGAFALLMAVGMSVTSRH